MPYKDPEDSKRYAKKYKRDAEYQKRRRQDPAYKEKEKQYQKDYYANPENYKKAQVRARNNYLRDAYGITTDKYEQMLAQQNGVCAICRKTCPTGHRLAVDHNHQTGQIRKLLCVKCNAVLAQSTEDPQILLLCIDYLKAHSQEAT